MRLDIEFRKFIRFISSVDFCVMYWSPEQIIFHKTILKRIQRLEVVLIENCINSVNLYINNEIYFYSVVGTVDTVTILTFCNMLSENVGYLYLFLSEWMKSGASATKIDTNRSAKPAERLRQLIV